MNRPNDNKYSFPELQQYTVTSEEKWRLSAHSQIIIVANARSSGNQVLSETVSIVQEEYASREIPSGTVMPVRYGTAEAASAGDLVIELKDIGETGSSEGYTIEIGTYVKINAPGERALMYGMRTVMQQLLARGCMPYGKIVDYPVMPERALHIDIGRKFYTAEWIIDRIKEMSRLRLNTLQLHFSENEGFTLMSASHPEVMSSPCLTKEQMKDIIQTAQSYHVAVIPSLDSPGHLGYALRSHPYWLLKDASGQAAKGALDITNAAARQFVIDLIDEYAELFADSSHFHIGGDEFINFEQFSLYPQLALYAENVLGISGGTGVDTYIDYLNGIAGHLENKGFMVRAWNDGFYRSDQIQRVELKPSIEITYWTKWHAKMAPVEKIMDMGHKVINFNDAYFYYVLGENAGYAYPAGAQIYNSWHPGVFPQISGTEEQTYHQPYPSGLIGASFSIWSDKADAQTEEQVSKGIYEPLRAMAEKSWIGEKQLGSYEGFQEKMRKSWP